MKKQKLPKWFTGSLYTSGDTVTNPFSGGVIDLNPEALSMYDFIWGCVMTNKTNHKDFNKGMNWFRKNFPEAYMVLLD
tara:strand:- start:622 stop:855 length:234 start_codon:yes stop_codon:yes gene_type:complete